MRIGTAIFYIFLLFFSLKTTAQDSSILKGYLGVQGGESFHYELHFTDSNNVVNGFSYTYAEPNKKVKTAFTGIIDKVAQTLAFQETAIVYNRGFESKATICLIQAVLKFVNQENGQRVFAGAITSSDLSNTSCSSGFITIAGAAAEKEIFARQVFVENKKEETTKTPMPTSKKIQVSSIVEAPASLGTTMPVKSTKEIITDGTDKSYEWKTDSVIIEIWDGGKLDGDIISLRINDTLYLKNYSLKQGRKKIVLPFAKGEMVLKIVAENEGNESPNTADILLRDGQRQYPIMAYNKWGKKAIIKLQHL